MARAEGGEGGTERITLYHKYGSSNKTRLSCLYCHSDLSWDGDVKLTGFLSSNQITKNTNNIILLRRSRGQHSRRAHVPTGFGWTVPRIQQAKRWARRANRVRPAGVGRRTLRQPLSR